MVRGILIVFVSIAVFLSGSAWAGSLEPSVGPSAADSQMYTLEQIYNRLNTGAAATKMGTFTEPSSGPTAGTMHTLDEIYNLAGLRAPVARTGQTLCYGEFGGILPSCTTGIGPGQDGDLKKGVAWPNPRFTDSNGTVTDNLTGLIWLKDANCTNFFSGDITGLNNRSWANALTAANLLASGRCGLTDGSTTGQWRLPNRRELFSLIDDNNFNPAFPTVHPFTGVQSNGYWSSTSYAGSPGYAWLVYLDDGRVNSVFKTGAYYVWPVRGGQ
jgi:hypothetical protein